MSSNIRETKIGFSKIKQANISTATADADLFRMTKLNASLSLLSLRTESDALEIGKDDEFANNQFLTAWDASGSFEKYISSEFLAWVLIYGLGLDVTVTNPESGTYRHSVHTQDPVTHDIELPYFTYVEQIRPGGSVVVDRSVLGCAIEDFTISLNSGPGRQAAKVTANWLGSGINAQPSGITLPAVTTEHLLPGASAAITIIGNDLVSTKRIISLEIGVKNNLRADTGYYPGSGFATAGDPTSGAVRGRLEWGNREITCKVVSRFLTGSTELTQLKAITEGTAVISLQGAIIAGATTTRHDFQITFHRVTIAVAEVKDADGLVDVECTLTIMRHASNGVLTAYCTNAVPIIG